MSPTSAHSLGIATLFLLISAAAASYYQPAPATDYQSPTYNPPVSHSYHYPIPRVSPNSLAYQFLAPHNAVRFSLGLPPLHWDYHLAGYAASYAEQRRGDCSLTHSGGSFGENIFWGSGSDWSAASAVESWVQEGHSYDVGSNSCGNGDCGHYTQIVWRSTTKLGCARVVCDNDAGVFIICSYDPPGNLIGSRPY